MALCAVFIDFADGGDLKLNLPSAAGIPESVRYLGNSVHSSFFRRATSASEREAGADVIAGWKRRHVAAKAAGTATNSTEQPEAASLSLVSGVY